MGNYSKWINWFRDVAPKPPHAAPGRALGAPSYDADRLRRVLQGRNTSTPFQHLSRLRSVSPAGRMIEWLKPQPAEVVDAAAKYLNWDRATEVILWLIEQPTTDAATAVKLFMRAEPEYYVMSKAENPLYLGSEPTEKMIQSFAANWTANRYARGGVRYDPSEVTPYGSSDIFFINGLNERLAKLRSEGVYPLPILQGLAGPFNGPQPKEIDVYAKQKGRGELFLVRFLFAGLGTWMMDDDINEADFNEWMLKSGLSDE